MNYDIVSKVITVNGFGPLNLKVDLCIRYLVEDAKVKLQTAALSAHACDVRPRLVAQGLSPTACHHQLLMIKNN